MLEISADSGSGLCRTVWQKNLYWRDTRFDFHGRHRSCRCNLCNLRISNFCFLQSAVLGICFNNLRLR
jgi:hypothetical protein